MAENSLKLAPVKIEAGLKDRVFGVLQQAVLSMDIYTTEEPPRLDERSLAEELGVSRTPVREALSRLEQEGLVRNIPRRGTFVVRKSRQEIVEIIEVWAVLEGLAANLVTKNCPDQALLDFRSRCEQYQATGNGRGVRIDEYSEANIRFHQDIISMSGNQTLIDTARRLFVHMRAIRASTIKHPARKIQSVIDHMRIVDALVDRKTAQAEKQVRDHALKLAEHVRANVHFLD